MNVREILTQKQVKSLMKEVSRKLNKENLIMKQVKKLNNENLIKKAPLNPFLQFFSVTTQ